MDGNSICLLLAMMFIHCPLVIAYVYGNLATYMISVFYECDRENQWDIDPSWMLGIFMANYSVGLLSTDMIRKKVGLKLSLATGLFMYITGISATYFTVQHSVWATSLTLMLICGIGDGIVIGSSLVCIAGGFVDSVGLASSLLLGSNALGGIALNLILTHYINPKNIGPDAKKGNIMYFTQSYLISNVPSAFLVFGGIVAALQLTGLALLKIPPETSSDMTECNRHRVMPTDDKLNQTMDIPLCANERKKILNKQVECTPFPVPEFPNDVGQTIVGDESIVNAVDVDKRELESPDMTPAQMLRTKIFYVVWFSLLSQMFCSLVDANYKLFGQMWIPDDVFLAFVGSCSSVLSVMFHFLCGYGFDRFGVKNVLMCHMAFSSLFMFLWYFVAMVNKWLYLAWTNILQGVHLNQYVAFPIISLKVFGETFYSTNFGLVSTAMLVGIFVTPPLISFLLSTYGWFELFLASGLLPFVSLILVVSVMSADVNEKQSKLQDK